MARLLAVLRRFGILRSDLPAHGRPHLRRDLGMDDWEGSIGTARPDRLWPVSVHPHLHSQGSCHV